jgi:Kef-type K+ transport system membrane component KefB
MLFFLVLYLVGDCFCGRVLKIVPSLVGYILVGIAFGPEGFDLICVPYAETFVILGNLGLVLLIVQAGLEMDYDTLKLVGLRGVIIAVVGTILPVTIGTAIATLYIDGWNAALCAGCSFGPTSAGIAINVLGRSSSNNQNNNILNLPVGQLIVAAAIVDDILALVVLSQLKALTTKTTNDITSNSKSHEKRCNYTNRQCHFVVSSCWIYCIMDLSEDTGHDR